MTVSQHAGPNVLGVNVPCPQQWRKLIISISRHGKQMQAQSLLLVNRVSIEDECYVANRSNDGKNDRRNFRFDENDDQCFL